MENRKINIGIDGRFFRSETGGLGRYTQKLIENLLKIDKQNQYFLFLTEKDWKEAEEFEAQNLTKVLSDIVHYSFSEQLKLPQILKKFSLDLVHFTNFNHPVLFRGKFVVTIHDLTMLLYPQGRSQKSKIRQFIMKKVFQNALLKSQRVIAVSNHTKKDLIRNFKTDPSKISAIYEGVDKKFQKAGSFEINKLKKKYNLKKPFLLFVSQWRPHKGILTLISAFEILKEKYQKDLQLVLIGKENPNFPEILQKIKKSKYQKDIILPGFVEDSDLPVWYSAASVFVFPSLYEGFGLPPLEAAACKTPVISSDASCMPEVLQKAAWYFKAEDAQDLAKTISKLLTSSKIQSILRKEGKEILKKYTWEKCARETLEVYKKVVER